LFAERLEGAAYIGHEAIDIRREQTLRKRPVEGSASRFVGFKSEIDRLEQIHDHATTETQKPELPMPSRQYANSRRTQSSGITKAMIKPPF